MGFCWYRRKTVSDIIILFLSIIFPLKLIILGLLIIFRARASFSSFLEFRSKKPSENERLTFLSSFLSKKRASSSFGRDWFAAVFVPMIELGSVIGIGDEARGKSASFSDDFFFQTLDFFFFFKTPSLAVLFCDNNNKKAQERELYFKKWKYNRRDWRLTTTHNFSLSLSLFLC